MSESNHETLVRMANQIAGFFASYPEESAVQSVADHINQFWSAPMRRRLVEGRSDVLHPLVVKAVARVRVPAAAPAAVE